MTISIPNTYLFVATFADGSQIFQDAKDISAADLKRSQFYDVLERAKETALVSFVIRGEHVFGVDLRDGHFEVNGLPFFQHRPDNSAENYKDFRVIYFRTPQIQIDAHTRQPISGKIHAYTIGWQMTHNGKNVKKTFSVYFD